MTSVRVFLESDVYGREYFDVPEDGDLLEQVKRLAVDAAASWIEDQITRRVGIEVGPEED